MRISIEQPPDNTSLMGVAKGILDHHGIDCTSAEVFVLSGHAFLINIHEELCPSGPYCWRYDRFVGLLRNVGLEMTEIDTLTPTADAHRKARLEATVRERLDRGIVCSLLGLDNQLVLGYDDHGFHTTQPWSDQVQSTPGRLGFGTWREYAAGPPVSFFEFAPGERRSDAAAVPAALHFAVDAWRCPEQFARQGYGVGCEAYRNWVAAIDAGHAGEHGNWWNAVVWAECRERAGDYFQALAAAETPGPVDPRQARELAVDYRALSNLLYRVSDKSASDSDKRRLVEQARDLETVCVERIEGIRSR